MLPNKIKKGKYSEVGEIIKSEFPEEHHITDTGLTCLGYACSLPPNENTEAMITTLLSNEMLKVINKPDDFQRTPLHMACNSGNEIAVSLLIQNGADLNAQTCGGETPLMKAAANGHYNIVNALL